MTGRPAHLPDYKNPPVSEVMLGVQFRPPTGYTQIRAGEVWNLFRAEYPKVEEHPPITPTFETFGPRQVVQVPFSLMTGASHDRFWFISEAETELIQFQEDRMLHNWRQMGVAENAYPRFEAMMAKFEDELRTFSTFVGGLAPQELEINQCEVTYINVIALHVIEGSRPGTWIKGFDLPVGAPEDFSYTFRRIIQSEGGQPSGRLICEILSGRTSEQEPVIRMTITVRGAPSSSRIEDALTYLKEGRDLIVLAFTEFTTDFAHRQWERVR
jgi:uncharacterized protein (TIGR04255 family)